MKLHTQPGGFCGGMTKAVIPHGAQSPGQHVSQIAADKLYARQSERAATVLLGPIFPAEGDGLGSDGEQTRIIDGGASDISAQILKGGSSGACRVNVHTPLLGPDLRVDLPIVLFE